MAYDDEDFPEHWSETERELFDELVRGEPEIIADVELQMSFHGALFDREMPIHFREKFMDHMMDRLWDEYGIDFELDFDWEGYREWYEGAAA